MIGVQSQALQIADAGFPRDCRKFRVAGDAFCLFLKPTRTRDGVEMQGFSPDKFPVLKVLFVEVDDELHFVFLCREEEGFQIVEIIDVDGGIWHRVDGTKDVFPGPRGILHVDVG